MEYDYIMLIAINILVAIIVVVFLVYNRKLLSKYRDSFIVLLVGIAIVVASLYMSTLGGNSLDIDLAIAFLSIKKYDTNWALTRLCLLGYHCIFVGLVGLIIVSKNKCKGEKEYEN